MTPKQQIARNLAATLLSGVWTPSALAARTRRVLGATPRGLIRDLLERGAAHPPSPAWLVEFLLSSDAFDQAVDESDPPSRLSLAPAIFAPNPTLAALAIPQLATPGALAAWLDLSVDELTWFAADRTPPEVPLQHYQYSFIARRRGRPRLIEAPKPRLKAIQRRILQDILDMLPAHERAYGFVKGRSCLDAARRHAGMPAKRPSSRSTSRIFF